MFLEDEVLRKNIIPRSWLTFKRSWTLCRIITLVYAIGKNWNIPDKSSNLTFSTTKFQTTKCYSKFLSYPFRWNHPLLGCTAIIAPPCVITRYTRLVENNFKNFELCKTLELLEPSHNYHGVQKLHSTNEISHDSRNEFIKIFYGKWGNIFVSRCIPVRLDSHRNTNNFFSSLSRQTVLTAVVSTQKLPNYFDVSRRWYSRDKWQLCEWKSLTSLSNEIQVIVQGTRGRRAKKRKCFAFRFSYFVAAFVFFFLATVYTKNVSLIKRFRVSPCFTTLNS